MFPRTLQPPAQSFFLFGPRGTGKSTWAKDRFPDAVYLDLLDSALYTELLAAPERVAQRIPAPHRGWVVIDEVQKLPQLLAPLLDQPVHLVEGIGGRQMPVPQRMLNVEGTAQLGAGERMQRDAP